MKPAALLSRLLALTAGVYALAYLAAAYVNDRVGFDFERSAVKAATAIRHGDHIYLSANQWRHLATAPFEYAYPPLYAELVVPFSLLPRDARIPVMLVICLACAAGALWLVGVRDPLVYVCAFASWPVALGSQVENASMVIMLLVAFVWRSTRPWPLAVGLALKPFVWPLLLWQWACRGRQLAARTVALTVLLLIGSWALVRFEGLLRYVSIAKADGDSQAGLTYAVAGSFTGGSLVAVALVAACLLAGWRRARRDDQAGAFTYALAAAVVFSPVVWMHTLSVLVVALAIRRPRFGLPWLFAFGGPGIPETLGEKLPVWAITATVVVWLGEGAVGWRSVPSSQRKKAPPAEARGAHTT